MSTNTHTSSVGSNEYYTDIAKLSRKGLLNYDRATGHWATASGGAPPRQRVGIDEEDPDSADEDDTDSSDEDDTDSADEDDTDSSDEDNTDSADEDDTTLLSGPHSGDKRLSSSCCQRKKGKKKGKMNRFDELIIKVCSIMSKKLELKLAKKQSEYGKEDTPLSGPHSGDKRLTSSYFERKEDKKKGKMNPVDELILKTCSLMTKNLEFKLAKKQSKYGKEDTTSSGPHSGDKRPTSSYFERKEDEKKGKMNPVDEAIIKTCSLMTKNLEFKLAKKQSEYGKEDTTSSGPHSGDKRPTSSYFERKEDEKKGKMNPVDEAIIKTCSLMTKNFEFKLAKKQSKCGKEKETISFLSNPYGMTASLEILQKMDMDMVLRVKALNWLMASGPEQQKTFVVMNPSFRLDWLMKHVG